MLIKCFCTNCAGHLEFEEENAGQKIKCPHCNFDTVLFLPGAEPKGDGQSAAVRYRFRRQWLILAGVGALLLAGVAWALYQWGLPFVESFLPFDTSKGVSILVLLLLCLVVPLVGTWLVLPLFLFFQSRKLLQLLSQIHQSLQPEVLESPTESEAQAEEEVGAQGSPPI